MPTTYASTSCVRGACSYLCLLSVCICIFVGLVSAERLPIKTYTVADGLLRDTVYKIKQDSRGFLWLCTVDGLSRFDGYAFKNFTVNDGLPDRHVNDFLETRSGEIWIATDKGVARLNPTGLSGSIDEPLFTNFAPSDPKAAGAEVLYQDELGTIWIGTSNGLYRFNDRLELERFELGSSPISISSIIKDRKGDMWLGTTDGVRRITRNGSTDRFSLENGLPGSNVSVVYEDKTGRLWAGFRPSTMAGLALLVADPVSGQNIVERHFTDKNGLPATWITDLRETSDGKFWVGTTSGLCEWQSGSESVCKTYKTKNDLCDREVWTLLEDKNQNLWIGSRCGAKKWSRYGFTSYTEADGLGYQVPDSIFEDPAGDLFVSLNRGDTRLLTRFDGEGFTLVEPNFPASVVYLGWGWHQTVRQVRDGSWLFPTGDGLYVFTGAKSFQDLSHVTPRKVEPGGRRNEIFRTFEDSRGDLWIATTGITNELWRWDRSSDVWRDMTSETGLGPDRLATSFIEDRIGNLWIGTGSDQNNTALIRYRDGEFTVFGPKENELLGGWLRDLFVDSQGRLWIASTTSGLLRLDELNSPRLDLRRYGTKEGISSDGAACVTEDEFGRVYVGTGRGLDRLDPETGQTENFTTADGLPNSYIEVAFRDRKNTLWFGTANGLARLVPEPATQRHPPNALLTSLRVNGESRSISVLGETAISGVELTSDQRQVTVEFVGLGASLGEKLRYEYRLGGSDWTPTNERTVNFANLAAGGYELEVRTITADRLYSVPAVVSFRIASPVWQRWWFIVGASAVVSLLIFLLYRYRIRQVLELERIRTRIATDLHDDIGSNLTRIALLSEVANQQPAENVSNGLGEIWFSIGDIARESVASMNDIVWAISPEHDSLLDLTRRMRRHAAEVFTFRNINLDFQTPVSDHDLKLSVGVRRDVLLIFKEAVSNAAKHSGCTEVVIDFRCEASFLVLRIKDNGNGFEPDSERRGHGLDSMTRRAAALGGELTVDAGPGRGTSIKLIARLGNSNRR